MITDVKKALRQHLHRNMFRAGQASIIAVQIVLFDQGGTIEHNKIEEGMSDNEETWWVRGHN